MLQNLDMQHTDTGSSYDQYYQSHFQNPNPSSNPTNPPPPQFNLFPSTFPSAPPVSSIYLSTEYPVYSSSSSSTNYSTNPLYPQYTDHAPNPPLTYQPNSNDQSSDPSPQPYNFPHLNFQTTPNYGFDQNQAGLHYDHSNPGYDSKANSSFSLNSYSSASNYENLCSSNYGRYGEQGIYGDVGKQRPVIGLGYDPGEYRDSVGGDSVCAYSKGRVEPYGARGSGSGSSSGVIFDDYGRPIGFENGKKQDALGSSGKVVKAIPKSKTQQDVGNGVRKYCAKLLSEGAGQTDMDVLCQIGLDGIQILDTATSRTLRIYPLETVTRCEVLDSYIFAFWAKSSIDFEPRRVRLKSNSYTTNNILDTVMAATFQIKEMCGRDKPSDTPKISEQASEKKKGFIDWMNLIKSPSEDKDHWVPDEAVTKCMACKTDFGAFVRRHHCRNCGDIFCDKCTQGRISLTADGHAVPVRVCDGCMAEVTQRMANAKETTVKVAALQSHEDLAKKLEEEMDKNRKISTGLTSGAPGMRMREVACPTCTVHLQVQLPVSGSETIECSVCQHPFLVGTSDASFKQNRT